MWVTNIQHFCLDDGPGIRTTIFSAGCNMRCLWCHNPENLKRVIERIETDKEGNTVKISNSLNLSVDNIVANILQDYKFYDKSGGGITVSGGEPVNQIDELEQLLKVCKSYHINTAIETALNYDYAKLERCFSNLDLIIADCKAISNDVHVRCTGVSNEKILVNLKKLSEENKRLWIRIPIIPNINIDFQEIDKIALFLKDINAERIELIPYHRMGIDKYKKWGMEYKLQEAKEPKIEYIENCYKILMTKCKNVKNIRE